MVNDASDSEAGASRFEADIVNVTAPILASERGVTGDGREVVALVRR